MSAIRTEGEGLGALSRTMREVLERIDIANSTLKDLKEKRDQISRLIQHQMEEAGVDTIKNNESRITLTLKEELQPSYDPEHFDEIFRWCANTGRHDFIQRRMSGAKIREFVESGGELPVGLTLTPVTKITFRRS